jgi:hypothetical protein
MEKNRDNLPTELDEVRTWAMWGFLGVVFLVVLLCFFPDIVEITRREIKPVYRVVGWMVFFGVFGIGLLRLKK